jgi:adenylosuccinate synthase
MNGYDSLPPQAKIYLERIEELVETQIRLVSIGPERSETIVVNN